MIKIYGNYRFAGMTIYPFVFIDKEYRGREKLHRHEEIHAWQQVEVTLISALILQLICGMWWLSPFVFYTTYLTEWIFRSIAANDGFSILGKGYRTISFEKEAYGNEDDVDYLYKRIPFSWIKYIW